MVTGTLDKILNMSWNNTSHGTMRHVRSGKNTR